VEVVDQFTGAKKTTAVIVRNVSNVAAVTKLKFTVPTEDSASFFSLGTVEVDLGAPSTRDGPPAAASEAASCRWEDQAQGDGFGCRDLQYHLQRQRSLFGALPVHSLGCAGRVFHLDVSSTRATSLSAACGTTYGSPRRPIPAIDAGGALSQLC